MQVEGTMWRLRKLLSLLDLVFPGSELAAPTQRFINFAAALFSSGPSKARLWKL